MVRTQVSADEPPIVDDVLKYVQLQDEYALAGTANTITPHAYWVLYKDTPLAKVGSQYSSLPATTADIERVWSIAGNITEGRERLTADHLHEELFIRWNSFVLDK